MTTTETLNGFSRPPPAIARSSKRGWRTISRSHLIQLSSVKKSGRKILIVRGLIVILSMTIKTMNDDQYTKKTFGKAVRAARIRAKISQEKLAELVGLDRTYIGGVERGERNPTLTSLQKIADGLGITPSKLLQEMQLLEDGDQ